MCVECVFGKCVSVCMCVGEWGIHVSAKCEYVCGEYVNTCVYVCSVLIHV